MLSDKSIGIRFKGDHLACTVAQDLVGEDLPDDSSALAALPVYFPLFISAEHAAL